MVAAKAELAKRCPIRPECVGHHCSWRKALPFQQFSRQFQRCGFVARCWISISSTSPSLSTARQRYLCRPPNRTTISSRCQHSSGLGRRRMRPLTNIGPNLRTHRRMLALLTSMPRSASKSSTFRKPKVKRAYSQTLRRSRPVETDGPLTRSVVSSLIG